MLYTVKETARVANVAVKTHLEYPTDARSFAEQIRFLVGDEFDRKLLETTQVGLSYYMLAAAEAFAASAAQLETFTRLMVVQGRSSDRPFFLSPKKCRFALAKISLITAQLTTSFIYIIIAWQCLIGEFFGQFLKGLLERDHATCYREGNAQRVTSKQKRSESKRTSMYVS